jgi:site-specific DNA-methyltransferase (adenine-specific)
MGIIITNEDNMVLMARYPDKYFQLAVVDPPYGLGMDGQREIVSRNPKHHRKGHARKSWDSRIPGPDYFSELFRVSDKQIIFGANYFVKHLFEGHRGWIVWYKGQQGLSMSDCELIYSSFDCPTRVITINRAQLQKDGDTIHPTQKPILLYKTILSQYAQPGWQILDTGLGSGSFAIACHELGFDLTACEIDPDYYSAAIKWLREYLRQGFLFPPDETAFAGGGV